MKTPLKIYKKASFTRDSIAILVYKTGMKKVLERHAVVITGLGTINPLAHNTQETWEKIKQGQSGAAPIEQFDTELLDVKFACEVKNFDPLAHFDKKEIRRIDRFLQLGIVAAREAVEDSGIHEDNIDKSQVACYLGSGMGGLNTIQEQYKNALEKPRRVSPFFIPSVISNMYSGRVSLEYTFGGPNLCMVTACSSSAHAIGEAFRILERGDAKMAVAGGAESTICTLAVAGFSNMKALSKNNDEYQTASKPFDSKRNGFVIGEGAAVLVLENKEHALKRGATIYAELVGYGRNSDAYHETNPQPEGLGASTCMNLALQDAELQASDIGHINTHGTSTPAGDKAETKAILKTFTDTTKYSCTSTKSMTGHTLGAAGALESLITVKALQEQVVPPTINVTDQDAECNIPLVTELRKQNFEYALSNSFGFGGTNASLIFKKWSPS